MFTVAKAGAEDLELIREVTNQMDNIQSPIDTIDASIQAARSVVDELRAAQVIERAKLMPLAHIRSSISSESSRKKNYPEFKSRDEFMRWAADFLKVDKCH